MVAPALWAVLIDVPADEEIGRALAAFKAAHPDLAEQVHVTVP